MFDLALSIFTMVLDFSFFQPIVYALIAVFSGTLFFKIIFR